MRRPGTALGVVVALLVVMVGIAEGVGSSAVAPRGKSVTVTPTPVVGTQVVCPDVVGRTIAQITRSTRVGVGLPAYAPAGMSGVGSVVISNLHDLGTVKDRTLKARGAAATVLAQGTLGDLVVEGSGPLAPGLAADMIERRDAGPYRGLDAVSCTAPSGDAWALGGATTVGQHTELRLTNTDGQPALVDVTLYGVKGPVNAPAALGVGINARSTRVVRLETLAPDEPLLLIHVQARSGRVATAIRVQSQKAANPQGVEWLPLTTPPATRAVVPGIVGGGGARRLVLANPGDTDATAAVTVVTASGSFTPRGLSAVTVPAGSVVPVDLTKPLAGGAAGVVVTADHPLVAAGWMGTAARLTGFADQAWTAAVPALTDPATSVTNLIHPQSSLLVLTAPAGAASVRISTVTGVGPVPPRTQTIRIGAGRTVQLQLAPYTGPRASVVAVTLTVGRGSGPLYAARVTAESGTRSQLLTVVPLRSSPEVRPVTPAVADLRVGLPN